MDNGIVTVGIVAVPLLDLQQIAHAVGLALWNGEVTEGFAGENQCDMCCIGAVRHDE